MTLFKISCDTCQTKLNVRQKSAIGQILACPKCGSMVQVIPPDEFENDSSGDEELRTKAKEKRPFVKPKPDPGLPETVSTISGSVAEGLEDKTGTRVKKRVSEERWHGVDPDAPPNAVASKSEPDLPGDQWDSNRTRQRKKLLIAFASTVAILVLGIAAIVFAAIQFGGGGNDSETAQNNQPEGDPSKTDLESGFPKEETTESKSTETPENEDPSKPNNSKGEDPEVAKKDTSTNQKENVNPVNPTGVGESSDVPLVGKQDDQGTGKKDVDPLSKKDPNQSDDSDAPPDFSGDDDTSAASAGIFEELEEFSVFEQDDILLTARGGFNEKDLAGRYGLTRFFVNRSLKKTPDPDRAMAIVLSGAKFEQITLLEFLDFLYKSTAVPVAVDVTPIVLSGVQLDQKVDLLVRDKSFGEILQLFAEKLGLQVTEEGKNALVITIPDRNVLQEKTYPIADLVSNDAEIKKLIGLIQKYVNDESWSETGGDGIISATPDGGSLVVKHFGWAQVRVGDLLRHLRIRHQVELKDVNKVLPDATPRFRLAQKSIQKEIVLFESSPISLSYLFAKLAKDYDVHVFVNWEATGDDLRPSGSLPLALENESIGGFISELAETVNLEMVWHSHNVVELTTQLGADSNLTLESYDITRSIPPGYNSERLLAALERLLNGNRISDYKRARIGLDPLDKKSIFAVLPQTSHRNIRAILDALSARKK